MTSITLPSGEWLLYGVPNGTVDVSQVHIYAGEDPIIFHDKDGKDISAVSLLGYQLHGSDPLNLTEEEVAELVGKHNGLYEYPDYQNSELCLLSSALESYSSLLAANGHKVGECVTLKKVK